MPITISEQDLVDLHGKVAIVTGGNTGIGYATVQWLARRGAKVYLAGRDEVRVMAAIKQLQDEGINDGSVHWLKLDLSDPSTVKKAGESILEKEERLDILVNNAAHKTHGPYFFTKDGLLDIMVINNISHFVLVNTVLPLMKTTAKEPDSDVRIVNLSSMAHSDAKPSSYVGKETFNKDFGDSFSGSLQAYAHSKLINILHIKELQRRLKAESIPITCIAVHPGPVKTTGSDGFLRNIPFIGYIAKNYIGPFFFVPWKQGAMTSAFAAAGKDVKEHREKYEGVYLVPVAKISAPSKYAQDERLAKEVYATTEDIVKELGL